jgi:2-dehydro-3-deoxygluconokinase
VISSRVTSGADTQARRSVAVDGDVVQAESAHFTTVDPLGGGDAFTAGFLSGLLAGDARRGLELGGAMAALKQSLPGDFPIVDAAEVHELANGGVYAGTRR